jgi:predicted FMN-binding regulatory protein PaiB
VPVVVVVRISKEVRTVKNPWTVGLSTKGFLALARPLRVVRGECEIERITSRKKLPQNCY